MRPVLIQLVCLGAVVLPLELNPLVNTKKGPIRGLRSTDGGYNMFLGVPYASVNYSNPFGLSYPYPDFDGVYEAYDDSKICPQINEFTAKFDGSLDCLRLNIYVPNFTTKETRLSVMVWIYGGGCQIGYATTQLFGPKYLVRHGVIFVTFNYRVGPYGFMCLDTPEVPGNQGFKDQVLALRWIKNNIEAFGGDATKVTVFGESEGSISIDFHLLYRKERLFDQAIMESGSAHFPFSTAPADTKAATKLAKRFGLHTDSNDEALAYLTTLNPRLLVAVGLSMVMLHDPCVEKEFAGVESFITEHPINRALPKTVNVTIMTGLTSNETMVKYTHMSPNIYKRLDEFHNHLNKTFRFEDREDQIRLVRQFYIGDEVPSVKLKQKLLNFESDFIFNYPGYRSVQNFLAIGVKVYNYLFSYSGRRNFSKIKYYAKEAGAAHADEIGYLFDMQILFKKEPIEEEQLMIDRLTTLWTNFAKYGDPTPETTDLLPVKWIPAEKDDTHTLNIDKEMKLISGPFPFHERMAFWEVFYATNLHLYRGYEDKSEKTNELKIKEN